MLARHPTEIEWSESLLPPPAPEPLPPAVEARVRSLFGTLPPWILSLQWSPWVVDALMDTFAVRLLHIDFDLVAQLRLVVAQENSCRYCYGTARLMLRTLGFSAKFVRALERDLLATVVRPRDRVALDYARLLSRAEPRPGTSQVRLLGDAGLSAGAIAEIAALTAMWLMATRITTLFALPPEPEAEGLRWWSRVVQPGLERTIRRQNREFPLAVSEPASRIDALEPILEPFADVPAGAHLRRVLERAFGDDGPLPRRSRLIVGAVIGRALGCDATRPLLASQLDADGHGPAAADALLARLDAEWLDERERLLLHSARDTVHIRQPLVAQRRMNELRSRLSPAEFVDFVGVASVANGLARLGVLHQRC